MPFASSIRRLLAIAIVLFAGVPAHAEPLAFGSRQLEVPVPSGFVPVSRRLPRFMALAQGYLPAQNRLVEAYLLPEDVAAMESGRQVRIKRYFQLQTLRKLDGVPVSAREFEEVRGTMEDGLGAALDDANDMAGQLARDGNAAAKRRIGVDPAVGMNGLSYLGAFRREPWALFFTTRMNVTTGGASTSTTAAAALALIDHQVAYLYAYTYEDDANGGRGRKWAEGAVSEWANTVRWANPDDPALEAKAQRMGGGFDWGRVVAGAGFGGLVALVLAFLRRGRAAR